MAFDEGLAQRVRELLADNPYTTEKKMFGGMGFIISGNMCVLWAIAWLLEQTHKG